MSLDPFIQILVLTGFGILLSGNQGKILGRTTPSSEQVGLLNKIVPLLSAFEASVKPPIGLSLFAVATK